MSTMTIHPQSDRTRAWLSLVLLPLAFVVAFAVGEGWSPSTATRCTGTPGRPCG